MRLDRYTVAINGHKDLTAPSGSFSLVLFPGRLGSRTHSVLTVPELYRLLSPGAIVSLGKQRRGGLMVGLVTTVARTEVRASRGRGRVSAGLRVTCHDFGKLFTQDGIVQATLAGDSAGDYFALIEATVGLDHVLASMLPQLWGPEAADGTPGIFLSGGVEDVIRAVLDRGISTQLPHLAKAIGGSRKPAELISTEHSVSTWGEGRIWNVALNDYQGTLWQFVRGLVDLDFYEVSIQSRPVEGRDLPSVELVVRPKPFDEPGLEWAPFPDDPGIDWLRLRTLVDGLEHHELPTHAIHELSLEVTDADCFSYFEVTGVNSLMGNEQSRAEGLYYPIIDAWALKRYGLRTYRSRVTLLASDIDRKISEAVGDTERSPLSETELHDEVAVHRNRLFNWYRASEFFESGTIKVAGNDAYRAGDPVYLPDLQARHGGQKGLRCYCTGYSFQWAEGGEYTHSLNVIRGHNDGVLQHVRELIRADAPPGYPDQFAGI